MSWLSQTARDLWDQLRDAVGGTTLTITAGAGGLQAHLDNPEKRKEIGTKVLVIVLLVFILARRL